MPNVAIYNMNGEKVGDMDLLDSIFGAEVNKTVLHMVVKNYLANQRQGTQSTLTRAEVSGGGAKPWRQKGTGRARQGSTRAPQWIHGGIALGPKPRDYSYTLNKKIKRAALKSALSSKVLDGELILVDKIAVEEFKTKNIANMLKALGVEGKALIIMPESDTKVIRSASNIPNVKTTTAGTLNTYDILNAGKAIITVDAALKLQEVYA